MSMRIISDELYAALVKSLLQDEKVRMFQQLIMAPVKYDGETADGTDENEGGAE